MACVLSHAKEVQPGSCTGVEFCIGDKSGPLVFPTASRDLRRDCKKKLIHQTGAEKAPKQRWAAFVHQQFHAKLISEHTGNRARIESSTHTRQLLDVR